MPIASGLAEDWIDFEPAQRDECRSRRPVLQL